MGRGRPFEQGNKFGRGRPRGSRNKATGMAQELLESHAKHLMLKAIAMGIHGEAKILHLLIDRILPARRAQAIKLGNLPTGTAAEISASFEKVVQRVASGRITVADGQGVSEMLEKRRRAVETQDIDARLRKLEVN